MTNEENRAKERKKLLMYAQLFRFGSYASMGLSLLGSLAVISAAIHGKSGKEVVGYLLGTFIATALAETCLDARFCIAAKIRGHDKGIY
ncbi:MAG: hypothetical protein J6Y85_01065 [Alphaproteobacteria bacterium]|nr:hypothetical protein [Alphaproteobacteria bacterium]